jgi:hypothetical protein
MQKARPSDRPGLVAFYAICDKAGAMDQPGRRGECTRQALLAAFRDLVCDQAYEMLTVGDIIERANVGHSTFYEHYEGKDELLGTSAAVKALYRRA